MEKHHHKQLIDVTHPPAGLPPPLLTVVVTSAGLSSKVYRYIVLLQWWVHVCNPGLEEAHTAGFVVNAKECVMSFLWHHF